MARAHLPLRELNRQAFKKALESDLRLKAPIFRYWEQYELTGQLIPNADEVTQFHRLAKEAGRLSIALAIQTISGKPALCGISFSIKGGADFFFPITAAFYEYKNAPRRAIRKLLTDRRVLKIIYQAKFVRAILHDTAALDIEAIEDLDLMAHSHFMGETGLAFRVLIERFFDMPNHFLDDIADRGHLNKPLSKPHKLLIHWSKLIAQSQHALYELLGVVMQQSGTYEIYQAIERRVLDMITQMEKNGITCNLSVVKKTAEEISTYLSELSKRLKKIAKRDFDPYNMAHIAHILYDKMEIEGGRKDRSGQWLLTRQNLQALSHKYEFVEMLLAYQESNSILKDACIPLLNMVNEHGMIYPEYNFGQISTGRIFTSKPYMPRLNSENPFALKLKTAFAKDRGGRYISADYDQIELRLLAYAAQCGEMADRLIMGRDIHMETGLDIFGIPPSGNLALTRRKGKALNFAIIYGMTSDGLASEIGVDRAEAQYLIDKYFELYPELHNYILSVQDEARATGMVKTPFGRGVTIPNMLSLAPGEKEHSARRAVNAALQAGAADLVKMSIVKCADELKAQHCSTRLIMLNFDELRFRSSVKNIDLSIGIIKKAMETVVTLNTPLIVDVKLVDPTSIRRSKIPAARR